MSLMIHNSSLPTIVLRPPWQVFFRSTRKLSMRGALQRAMEAELGLTSTYKNACIGPDYNRVLFRCAQLSALQTSFSIDESCFSIRTVWADYRYGGSSIDDTRHRGQLVRVSANFRALKNTERAGHDGKATFVTLSTKCDMLPWPNHDCHGAAIDRSID